MRPVANEQPVPVTLQDLDPGIRDVVAALWECGLTTTDSGDGVSKGEHGTVLPFEHVAIDLVGAPNAAMAAVAAALTATRPGELWQVEHTRSRTEFVASLLEPMAVAYEVGVRDPMMPRPFRVERRGSMGWAVLDDCFVLCSDETWSHEPLPSSRSEAFKSAHRFPLDEACRLAAKLYGERVDELRGQRSLE